MEYTVKKWVVVPTGIGEYPYCIDTEDKEVAKIHGLRNNAEAKANARLIAAAPDLYEACKNARHLIGSSVKGMVPGLYEQLNRAIAKVENATIK